MLVLDQAVLAVTIRGHLNISNSSERAYIKDNAVIKTAMAMIKAIILSNTCNIVTNVTLKSKS